MRTVIRIVSAKVLFSTAKPLRGYIRAGRRKNCLVDGNPDQCIVTVGNLCSVTEQLELRKANESRQTRTVKATLLFLGGLLLYFSGLAIGGRLLQSFPKMWMAYGVPAKGTFLDLSGVTEAIGCFQRNPTENIYASACLAAQNISFNYPRVWLKLALLGVGPSTRLVYGMTAGMLLVLAFLVAFPVNSKRRCALYLCCVLSPAVMLVVERGNTDAQIFVLLTGALVLIQQTSFTRRSFGYAFILLASILKLYPIFAFIVAVRETSRHRLMIWGTALSIFAIYSTFIRLDLVAIARNTPEDVLLSYGAVVIPHTILTSFDPGFREWLKITDYSWSHRVATALLMHAPTFNPHRLLRIRQATDPLIKLFVGGVALWIASRAWRRSQVVDLQGLQWKQHLFRVGCSIYIITFCFAVSFHYRLIFVLFTLPRLLTWVEERGPDAALARISIAALAGTLWLTRLPFWLTLDLDQLAAYVLFFGLSYLLACDLRQSGLRLNPFTQADAPKAPSWVSAMGS